MKNVWRFDSPEFRLPPHKSSAYMIWEEFIHSTHVLQFRLGDRQFVWGFYGRALRFICYGVAVVWRTWRFSEEEEEDEIWEVWVNEHSACVTVPRCSQTDSIGTLTEFLAMGEFRSYARSVRVYKEEGTLTRGVEERLKTYSECRGICSPPKTLMVA